MRAALGAHWAEAKILELGGPNFFYQHFCSHGPPPIAGHDRSEDFG